MKRIAKSMSAILILLVALFSFNMVAFASTTEQDGLKVELTTDKENYSLNEDIKINVTVTNTNDVAVEKVKIDTLLPEEFTLKDKNKSTSSETIDIPAGEKTEFSVIAVVKDDKTDTTSSDTDSKLTETSSNDDSKTQAIEQTESTSNDSTATNDNSKIQSTSQNKSDENKNDTTNKISGSDKSPYTGKDYAVMTGFSALFIIGIVLLILCLKRNRKKTSKAVSSTLCLVLAVTSIIGLADFKAKAENKQSDTDSSVIDTNADTASVISISENISVGDKSFTITVNINYVNALTQKWFKDIEENHIAMSNTGIEYIDNRIIVLFSSETTEEQKKNVINRVNGKLIGNDNDSKYQIQIETTENLEELKSICLEISKMNGVLWCFYETVDKISKGNELLQSVPNDPWKDTFQGIWGTDWNEEAPSGLNWWLETIQAPSAWDYSNRFNSVKIGVVDNGFDTNHEDLNINLINPNENSSDINKDHGTHVAGIIGATANNEKGITGIVWNKELYCADVIATKNQNKNYVSILNKYDGIEKTLEKGCKVVNLSMGAEKPIENNNDVLNSGATAAAYLLYWEQTIKRDFIIVQSAGNSDADSTKNGSFASITDDSINYLFDKLDISFKDKYTKNDIYKYFIVVGAIEKDGNDYKLCDHRKNMVIRWASCYGNYVSIVAPGKDIFSTIYSGGINGNYGYNDGTSMAAPIVSGVTALVWSINPNFTANEVKHIVCNSYNKTANGYQQSDNRAYPVVNAKLAVEEAIRRTDNKGNVSGRVKEAETKNPISNLEVRIYNEFKSQIDKTRTDDNGSFNFILPAGKYILQVGGESDIINDYGYWQSESTFTIESGVTTVLSNDILLNRMENGITGYVYDNDDLINNGKNTPIADVEIEVYKDNNLIGKTTTDKNGKYSISVDKNGSYDLLFKKSGYNDEKKPLTIVNGGFANVNAYLIKGGNSDDNVKFAGGDGTEANPYQISTPEQLNAVRNNLSAHYVQINDIDMSNWGNWEPIGVGDSLYGITPPANPPKSDYQPFTGIFDGGNHSIRNLKINDYEVSYVNDCHGLFSSVDGGIIKNIKLLDIDITINKSLTDYAQISKDYRASYAVYAGGIVGEATDTTIDNCYVSGKINVTQCENAFVGGISGNGMATNCISNVDMSVNDITSSVWCGGIVGQANTVNDKISYCSSYGSIDVFAGHFIYCGGISGEYGYIEYCRNYGDVSGNVTNQSGYSSFAGISNVGGIVGATSSNTTAYCLNYGNISSYAKTNSATTTYLTSYAGGISGYNGYYGYGNINNCYNYNNNINSYIKDKNNKIIIGCAGRIAAYSINTTNCYSINSTIINGSIPTNNISTDDINGGSLTKEEMDKKIKDLS